MHEHAAAVTAAPLLYAATTALVLSATLFGLRRLLSDWHRLGDRLTPATHVAMGAAMTYTMLVPRVLPAYVGAAALVLVGVTFLHRAHVWAQVWWTAGGSTHGRAPLTPGMTMTMVMAVMFMGAERGSVLLRLALLGCLLGCAAVYARPALEGRGGGAGLGEASTPLVLTAGMAAMLALP